MSGVSGCVLLNPSGNVQRCSGGANVMCEKTLVKDSEMCLNKTDIDSKITVNASTLIRFVEEA